MVLLELGLGMQWGQRLAPVRAETCMLGACCLYPALRPPTPCSPCSDSWVPLPHPIAVVVSRGVWIWWPTGDSQSMGAGGWLFLAGWKPERPSQRWMEQGDCSNPNICDCAGHAACRAQPPTSAGS